MMSYYKEVVLGVNPSKTTLGLQATLGKSFAHFDHLRRPAWGPRVAGFFARHGA